MAVYANTTPFTAVGTPLLPPLTKMTPGQYLLSPSGRFKFILQTDGNAVIYDNGVAVWNTQSGQPYTTYQTQAADKSATFFITQYYAFLNDTINNRNWGTANSTPLGGNVTAAYSRTYMVLQDDGNLVLTDTFPLWSSTSLNSFSLSKADLRIEVGTSLEQGKAYASGDNILVFQPDGNLVVYGPNSKVLWASYTQGKGATSAVMQGDGNFVIYAGSKALWWTATAGNPDAYAQVQANGSFSVCVQRPVWARFGFTPKVTPKKTLVEYGPYSLPSFAF